MKKITHWVLGTATARVSGDTARFINIAVKTGLRPIRLQKDGKDTPMMSPMSNFLKSL